MTQSRADEIVRKVIYARLNVMPKMENSEDAFHVGRMIGQMQRQLEIELSLEVEPQAESCKCMRTIADLLAESEDRNDKEVN